MGKMQNALLPVHFAHQALQLMRICGSKETKMAAGYENDQ
jgi:hypothetical protein